MASKILVIVFIIAIATSAMAITTPQKLLLLSGGGVVDTASYVYFTADRVVFGTDPITI